MDFESLIYDDVHIIRINTKWLFTEHECILMIFTLFNNSKFKMQDHISDGTKDIVWCIEYNRCSISII